jgi:hypothetical protein
MLIPLDAGAAVFLGLRAHPVIRLDAAPDVAVCHQRAAVEHDPPRAQRTDRAHIVAYEENGAAVARGSHREIG